MTTSAQRPTSKQSPTGRRFDPILALLAALSFGISAAWAYSVPIPTTEAARAVWGNFNPDEHGHIAVIEYMARYRSLPPYRWPYDTSVHPPLYHAGGAVVDALSEPLLGQVGTVLLLRLLSAAIGAGVVIFTYSAAVALSGRRTALLAAALVALIPMRMSIAGAITNENLAALGAAGACAALAWGLRRGFDTRRTLSLAIWTAVGIGSKLTCLGLLLAAAVALIWDTRRRKGERLRTGLIQLSIVCGLSALCIGWWLVRNVILYGDPVRSAAADRLWNVSQPGASVIMPHKHWAAWRYAASIYANGWLSFWGMFDGMNHPMPRPVYAALLAFQTIALVGLARLSRPRRRRRVLALAPLLASWAVLALSAVLVYTQYNWHHYTPQGRYFFVLLTPFGTLTALGWRAGFPRRRIRRIATAILLAALAILNLWALYVMPRRIGNPKPAPPMTAIAHIPAPS